jgi:hypothetical protein
MGIKWGQSPFLFNIKKQTFQVIALRVKDVERMVESLAVSVDD